MLQASAAFNPVSFWKQRNANPNKASDDPGLFSFEFGLNGEVERTELITQFGGKEDHTQSCLGYAPKRADRNGTGVAPEDWEEQTPDELIELVPYAMPCTLDYYQNQTNTKAWQGYAPFTRVFALEKCMTFNQQFNFGSFNLPVPILQGWTFELPEPNFAIEVGLCFPWFGNSVGRFSQMELAITLLSVEVGRFTLRWNNFVNNPDFRFQATTIKNTFIWPDIIDGNLRSGDVRGTPISLLQEAKPQAASNSSRKSRPPRPPRPSGMWQRDLTFTSLRMDNRSGKPVVDQVYRNSHALKKLGGHGFRHRKASLRQQTRATLPLLQFDSDSILPGLAM